MAIPIAGAMTAAASLGRLAGGALRTTVAAARNSPLAPAFRQLAGKLRGFDPAMLAGLLQPGSATGERPATAPPPPRPHGGALASALRGALARDTAPAMSARITDVAAHQEPAAPPAQHGSAGLDGVLAHAWGLLETALRDLPAAVPGGRPIGAEMLALLGPRLHALNRHVMGLLPQADITTPAASPAQAPESQSEAAGASRPAPPAPTAEPQTAAADEAGQALRQELAETGERNALDLVGGQAAPGEASPQHGHAHTPAAAAPASVAPQPTETHPGARP